MLNPNPNPNPNPGNFEKIFDKEFSGMTDDLSVTQEELVNIRSDLIKLILENFTENERKFLLSLKTGLPDWSLMSIQGIEKFPAILWKLENIRKIPENKKEASLNNLKEILKL